MGWKEWSLKGVFIYSFLIIAIVVNVSLIVPRLIFFTGWFDVFPDPYLVGMSISSSLFYALIITGIFAVIRKITTKL